VQPQAQEAVVEEALVSPRVAVEEAQEELVMEALAVAQEALVEAQ
jgi:hypothetical protein